MGEWIWIQWPAMIVTVGAAWLTGSPREGRRHIGFWLFLLSNVAWIVWGWLANAPALILLQIFLAVTNIRGAKKSQAT